MKASFPDLKSHGYEVEQRLGVHAEGGRFTWLAREVKSGRRVVVKEFRLADPDATWAGLEAHEREIRALRELDHPRIPKYLGSFATGAGFCLVQEYLDAPPLAQRQSFDLHELERIAASVLEVLVYLQRRIPAVVHRDVKPGNILVTAVGDAYLVDFGLARPRSGKPSVSSIAVGTPGFMPPEQLFGRPLASSSDLYGLGATLICLMSGRTPADVGDLVDNTFRFRTEQLPAHVPAALKRWLEKLVEPEPEDRFPDAAAALEALRNLDTQPALLDVPSSAPKPKLEPEPIAEMPTAPVRVESLSTPRAVALPESPSAAGGRTGALIASVLLVAGGGAVLFFLFAPGEEKTPTVFDPPTVSVSEPPVDVSPIEMPPEPKPEPEPMEPPAPPETPEEPHKPAPRYEANFCSELARCYTEEGYMGSVTTRVEADIGRDGAAKRVRVKARGTPKKIVRCLRERMMDTPVPGNDGERGLLHCSFTGNVHGRSFMLSFGHDFEPAGAKAARGSK